MKIVKSIDLWTEQHENHYECFNGGFIDGFENNIISLGILPDKENVRADVYADILNMEDIEIKF